MRRSVAVWGMFAILLMASQIALAADPSVTIDELKTGDNVGGTFYASYSWKDCTGVAKMRVVPFKAKMEWVYLRG